MIMKEHQYSEYIVNITIHFITGSEKKNRILIPRKCSGSWKAGQGISYWRIVARKNLVLQETVYMRTMYNKCHSLHQGFIIPGFIIIIVVYKL